MASSKMMASTSAAKPDLPRQSSIHPFSVSGAGGSGDRSNFGSMNMDELLKNMYADDTAFPVASADAGDGGGGGTGMSISRQGSLSMPRTGEVWNDMVTGQEPGMTLEDFLAKAGAVTEEDVRIPVMPTPGVAFSGDPMVNSVQFQVPPHMQSTQSVPGGFGVDSMGFADGIEGRIIPLTPAAGGSGGGVGRGKRRPVEEPPMDKATQQKQRRMIKNRESAARSRERKQAYTIELESLVTQLEEENAMLLKEEVEVTKERYKQLMKNLIPVVEQRKPPRALRRVNSW